MCCSGRYAPRQSRMYLLSEEGRVPMHQWGERGTIPAPNRMDGRGTVRRLSLTVQLGTNAHRVVSHLYCSLDPRNCAWACTRDTPSALRMQTTLRYSRQADATPKCKLHPRSRFVMAHYSAPVVLVGVRQPGVTCLYVVDGERPACLLSLTWTFYEGRVGRCSPGWIFFLGSAHAFEYIPGRVPHCSLASECSL